MLTPVEKRAGFMRGMQRYLAQGTSNIVGRRGIELPGLRRDGSIFPLELSVNEMHGNGRLRFVGIIRDITLRKQAEKRLADSEKFLKTITDNIPALIAYVDAEERYRFANASYKPMMDCDPALMIGKTIQEVLGEVTDRKSVV